IPLQTVFKSSTIAQFSQAISQQEKYNLAAIKHLPNNRDNITLSLGQERLWFLQQLEENSPSYNMSTSIKINGALDIKVLKRSIIEITRRHEILRTSFPVINGTSVQKIHPEINFEIEVFDSPLEIEKILTTEAQKPFNLSQSPLFRVTLLRLSEREQILLLMMHHIISDGWSIGVLIRELTTLYLSYSQQKPSPLPEIPVQYADYAVWQRNYLQEKILENQLNYWKQQLANIPPLLNLPTDRPRPPIQTYQGESFTIKIAPELSNKIKALAKKSGTTLYMTLLAGFATLLYRYSHQKDICIGSPIANRNHSEIEELIGFFVNTIVLRSRFENNPSFSELLTQIKQVTLDAYVNADLPFDRVVQALQPERNLSHSALFQVMFVWNKARKAWQLPEIELTEIEPKSVTAKFDITLAILEEETELITSWEYKTELFDRETILAMANNFITLLTAITKDPEQKVSQLNLLTKEDSNRLVSQWNNTEKEYALEPVDRLFERQIKLNHQAVAIEFETEKITYLELNNRANKLANYLQKLGVKAEVKVGICLERSIEMVIGLLAIIKAGGAYIPLDPKYPRSRIDYMLEDSQTKILLTQDKLQENFDKKNLEIISVDRDRQTISLEPETNLVSPKNGDNLAYVIYTSGSTGKPKGVEICHKSLTNFLTSMSLKPGLKNSDTLLAITTICFDIAALEIYLPLIVGAKIILASEEQSADGNQLKEILERNEITVMQATPATWRSLLAANWQGKERLKILCGGEKLTPDLANNLLTKSAELWNLYGPTEATIWATINKIEESKETKNSIVSIGHPIANTRVYILDKHLKPVPLGVAGELYIGGIQLARGYLNKPQLTKERFIDSPWGRLYKTGDLVRYLKNGKIEYLDRADNQVKIRGFRIELGEIESILNTHPDIQQAIVTAKDEILVAYLVLEGTTNNKQQDIKDYLKQQLPEYMIPSAFVVLETFPLTPNGKIDRKALPLPDLESIDRKEYIPPRNDLEKRLVQIWTEVLKIKEIGVVDSFFDLGGHSLLAIRLMAQIEQEYGKKIPLTSLFQNPTIAQLAKLIRSDSIETNSVLVPIKTTGKRSPLFCIHPIEGSVFCYQDLANHLKDYPVYGLQSIGLEGHSTPLTKIEDMASQYIEAIETIQQTGPYHLAGWSLGGVIAFEIARQLSDRGEKIAYLSLIDSHSPSTINFSKTKDQSEFFVEITENLSRRLNLNFDISLAEIKALSPEDKFKYLFNRAKELKILPLEKIEQLLQVYQANFMAFSQYQPKKYSGIINLFRASENQKKSFALGWDKIAKVKTIIIASNHYQIIRSDRLSQYIKKQLN
ncbi:MAG: amino acid adenylation domain-containing protein, partial [Prochloraceae cyanobacterium]